MTSSKIYWQQREAEALKHYLTEEKEYQKRINDIYDRMLDDIQKEIDAFYGRYADKEGITLAEAKKRVKTADIKEFERKAKKYVKDKNFSKQANEEMRLYNLMMKVNRLEMLKANIGLKLISNFDELNQFMEEILQDRTEEELERQAGILGNTIQNNAELAHMIVNASFHNATFSDRIWLYQDLMRDELGKLLEKGLIQGKNPRVLARELNKVFNTGKYNCERLMRTELTRVQIEAQRQSYIKNGFKMYTFIANSDCCDVCKAITGKHFNVADMLAGTNAPPMHPHCRCSTAPYSDDKEYEDWLDFVSNGGTTEEWEKIKSNAQVERGGSKRIGTNEVDLKYIASKEFRNKFNKITDNTAVNDALRNYATAMLTHRNSTDGEDLYIINAKTGKMLTRKIAEKEELQVSLDRKVVAELRQNYFGEMIGIHNHPTNVPPTGSDFTTAGYRGYKFGIVVTHSGKIYKYECGDRPFLSLALDERIDKYTQKDYNLDTESAYKKALDEFQKEYGIKWEEI